MKTIASVSTNKLAGLNRSRTKDVPRYFAVTYRVRRMEKMELTAAVNPERAMAVISATIKNAKPISAVPCAGLSSFLLMKRSA